MQVRPGTHGDLLTGAMYLEKKCYEIVDKECRLLLAVAIAKQ